MGYIFNALEDKKLFKSSGYFYLSIAKRIKGIEINSILKSGHFRIFDISRRPLHLCKLPKYAIKEVYLGARAYDLKSIDKLNVVNGIRSYQPCVKIYGCKVSHTSWALETFDIDRGIS